MGPLARSPRNSPVKLCQAPRYFQTSLLPPSVAPWQRNLSEGANNRLDLNTFVPLTLFLRQEYKIRRMTTESQRLFLQHQALTQLEEALATIEDYEKEDYLKALEVAPRLVFLESDPTRFLLFTNFNTAAAARKLVMYWKRRHGVFGDRAFLPLTLTGNGALSNEDIEFIKTGELVFLPNDADGRTVISVDHSRRVDHSLDKRLRSMFYYGQVIYENAVSQTDGFAILVISNDGKFMDHGTMQCRNLLLHTFPIKLKAFHMVKCMRRNWANIAMPRLC
jgi:hypothetical protein